MLEDTEARFRTTAWTILRAMGAQGAAERQIAMNALLQRYWPAVYAFLRSQGENRDRAAELTQAFFADVVIGRSLFDGVAPEAGRLRTLILVALRRFRIDKAKHEAVRRRGQTFGLHEFEIEDAKLAPVLSGDKDEVFDRRWAQSMFEESLRRCEAHFRLTGLAAHWELFEARVLAPAVTGNRAMPLRDHAASTSFRTPALAAAAVQVVKRRAADLMREVVAETLDEGADVDAELNYVRRCLGAHGNRAADENLA